MVSLQREDQKDQHWERKRQSEGSRGWGKLRARGARTLLGVRAQGHGPPGMGSPRSQRRRRASRFPSGRLIESQPCCATGWQGGLPGLQRRLRASFPMQHDGRERRDRWMNAQLDRQTDGFCRR